MTDLGPFHDRPAEWELYQPLVGSSMLELGNKKNREHTYKAFFEANGYRHVSIDWNGQDGALQLDLRRPLNLGTFDMVTNIGTTEHVSDQAEVWHNVLDALHIGSVLLSTTPLPPDDWHWHGAWHVDEAWMRDLCGANGLEIERLYVSGDHPRRMLFLRAVCRETLPFVMPGRTIHYNGAP
jgi:hypothetical protein